jgi:hypothetical protein
VALDSARAEEEPCRDFGIGLPLGHQRQYFSFAWSEAKGIERNLWERCRDQTGARGSAIGQLSSPTGVAVDAQGRVYVADKDNNRVQRFASK